MEYVIDKHGCVYRKNDKRVREHPERYSPAPAGAKAGKCLRRKRKIN